MPWSSPVRESPNSSNPPGPPGTPTGACQRCGYCCEGIELAFFLKRREWTRIRAYLADHPFTLVVRAPLPADPTGPTLAGQTLTAAHFDLPYKGFLQKYGNVPCPFLDHDPDGRARCVIYPVRPRVCRKFRCTGESATHKSKANH